MNHRLHQLILLLTSLSFAVICWANGGTLVMPHTSNLIHTAISAGYFDAIDVQGNINLKINVDQKQQSLTVTATKNAFKYFQHKVVNHTLYLSLAKPKLSLAKLKNLITKPKLQLDDYLDLNINLPKLVELTGKKPGNIHIQHVRNQKLILRVKKGRNIDVSGHHIDLRRLIYSGSGTVNISNINSPGLSVFLGGTGDVHLKGNYVALRHLTDFGAGTLTVHNIKTPALTIKAGGKSIINLRGVADLRNLNYNGNGLLDLNWVKSDLVTIYAKGRGTIKLAGVARTVFAELRGRIHLDARFLRTQMAYIHTKDFARADTWTLGTLNAWANDYSDIYYFSKPAHITTDMQEQGAVLSMRTVPSALLTF